MQNNCIGFLGTTAYDVNEDGAGFSGKNIGDLVSSSDPNFRPVDLEFAPDGSLYFIDWYNPLIGHMQHNIRDPNRDTVHGRIYRVTHTTRPLVTPAKVAGASITELLDNLKLPEYRARYRSRRELAAHPADKVLPAVKAWVAKLDRSDPLYERHLVEGLWVTWRQNRIDADLLKQCLGARAHQARAAAVEVIRNDFRKIPNAVDLLLNAAKDEHGRVRLAAVVAGQHLDGVAVLGEPGGVAQAAGHAVGSDDDALGPRRRRTQHTKTNWKSRAGQPLRGRKKSSGHREQHTGERR
jgi:hypothetical protein